MDITNDSIENWNVQINLNVGRKSIQIQVAHAAQYKPNRMHK